MNAAAHPKRDYFTIVLNGALGLFLCTHWIFFPMPDRSRLTEHNGALISYSVETSNSMWERRKKSSYVFFKVEGENGRFWTEAVKPENAPEVFSRPGATVRFYIDEHDNHILMNGDGRKSFGLVVDGREIQDVNVAVSSDRTAGLFLLPLIGLGFLGYAFYRWTNPAAQKVEED